MSVRWLALAILALAPLASANTQTPSDCSPSSWTSAWAGMTGAAIINFPNCNGAGVNNWTSNISLPAVPSGVTSITINGNTTITWTGTPGTSSWAYSITDNTIITDSYQVTGVVLITFPNLSVPFVMNGLSFFGGTQPNPSSISHPDGFLKFGGSTSTWRITNCDFNALTYSTQQVSPFTAFGGGGFSIYGPIAEGVVDHNVFQMYSEDNGARDYAGVPQGFGPWSQATQWGQTSGWVYAESDYFYRGAANDCDYGAKMVIRYSTILDNVNSPSDEGIWQTHGIGQGKQNALGCRALEIYHNYISNPASASPPFTAGDVNSGTAMVWANQIVNYQYDIGAQNYRASGSGHTQNNTPGGIGTCGTNTPWDGDASASYYPCLTQTGRGQGDLLSGDLPPPNGGGSGISDSTTSCTPTTATSPNCWPHQQREPVYMWLETMGGTGQNGLYVNQSLGGVQMTPNRDFYIECGTSLNPSCTSAFNGTLGTGSGLLSGRPSTCTAGPGGTFDTSPTGSYGVAYWATDANSGNGELYVCTSTNTWTATYQPLSYPHPLVGGSGGPVTLSPVSQAFGNVNLGSSSSPVAFTLSNGSSNSMSSVVIATTGGAAADYVISGSTCGSTLSATASCTLNVTFTPLASGSRVSTLQASYTGGDSASPQTAALSGTGIAATTAPSILPVSGVYYLPRTVGIMDTQGGVTICYTTDGSTPTANGAGTCTHGTTYSATFSLSLTSTVKAIASKSGFFDSSVTTATFTANLTAQPPPLNTVF